MSDEHDEQPEATRGIGRRGLFTAVGAAAVTGVAGAAVGWMAAERPAPSTAPDPTPSALPAADRRPGVTEPAVPQRHMHVAVLDEVGDAEHALAAVRAVNDDPPRSDADAGMVTVTIGFGARLAGALWPDRATGDMSMPGFAGDTADLVSGGDIAVQVCAETASAARDAVTSIIGRMPRAAVRWRASGYRDAPTPEGTARTSTGFIDGIANPRTPEELAAGVWTGPEQRDTYVVYRRMQIDSAFLRRPVEQQEAAIGRHRDTGAPLSGGGPTANIDLLAKSDAGRVLIPQDAHARRAHPANLGRALMLRRSYSYDPPEGAGLIFTAFVNDPQTFVVTQRRLDESDAFLANATTDASGLFFVPELSATGT